MAKYFYITIVLISAINSVIYAQNSTSTTTSLASEQNTTELSYTTPIFRSYQPLFNPESSILKRLEHFPVVYQFVQLEKLLLSILKYPQRINWPIDQADQHLVVKIEAAEKMNAIQKFYRKLLSLMALSDGFKTFVESKYMKDLLDGPFSKVNPYASYLDDRLNLLKELRTSLETKLKNATLIDLRYELQKSLSDTEREISRYE